MYNSLGNSYMWNMLNRDGAAAQKALEAKKVGELVSPAQMPIPVSKYRNRLKSPIASKVFEWVETGKIQMIYTDPSFRVPTFMPFMTVMDASAKEAVGLIYLASCNATKAENEYDCDEYRLKSALEACYFSLKFFDKRDSPKLTQTSIIHPAVSIYAFMVAESINRKHSIRVDPDTYNQILYLLSFFFVKTVMGIDRDKDVMESYCLRQTTNPNLQQIHRVTEQFEDSDFVSIDKLLTKMISVPELKKKLGNLTVSNFTEAFINTYDAVALLALENMSYLVFNVLSVLNATYANNYHVLKQIMGENGKKLYSALVVGLGDV